MKRNAVISECGHHRYFLSREWAEGGRMLFIMLNPSTADADNDDPTIRRCISFAKREGFGSISVVNLFSKRAASPAALREISPIPSLTDETDQWIERAVANADKIIAAWGAHPEVGIRGDEVAGNVVEAGMDIHALKLTKAGKPGHPLYVKAYAPLMLWRAKADHGHIWQDYRGTRCCERCGIVRRRDGGNNPCPGVAAPVAFRRIVGAGCV